MNALPHHEPPAVASSKPAIPRYLLALGLIGGAASAAVGLVMGDGATGLPMQAVARVNQHLISRDAWLRAVAAVASERRAALTADEQRRILDRLIDEELLVQHGVALGLVERDARLRSQLVSEVVQVATAAAPADPSEAVLRRFYADQRDLFTPTPRLRVAAWRQDADGARRSFEPPVPDVLLPPAKLETYLGPALTARAMSLPPLLPSEPIASGGERVVLEVLEKWAAAAPPFERVRDQVRAEVRRRADEAAVRALLAELRSGNRVVVAPDLP